MSRAVTPREEAAARVARELCARIDIDAGCDTAEVDTALEAADFSETGEPDDAGLWVRAWLYVSADEIELELGQ